MRNVYTIATKHDGSEVVLLGKKSRLSEHLAEFKNLPAGDVHEEFCLVELVGSSLGISRRRKYITAAEGKRLEKAEEKRRADELKRVAEAPKIAESERKAQAEAKAKAEAEEKAKTKAYTDAANAENANAVATPVRPE